MGKASKVERVKPAEEIAGEKEFYRRRNFPGVEVRYLDAGSRCPTVLLTYCGIDLGSKNEVTRRGKVVAVCYVLPSLDRYNARIALPVAK